MSKKYLGIGMLILTAMIWGAAFVAQKAGSGVGAFTYNGVRCLLGALVLLPVVIFGGKKETKKQKQNVWIGGILCGIVLSAAIMFQQFGLETESAGKGGFITAIYIVIVPLVSVFIGKKPNVLVWFGVLFALIGMYLLCFAPGEVTSIGEFFSFTKGEKQLLMCAVMFSVHILVVDNFSPKVNGVKLSCIQFFTAGIICSIGMFMFEDPEVSRILVYWKPLLYSGLLSSGVGYTLQIVGQKHVQPVLASLIMSLESVFAVLFAWILPPFARMSEREIIGCVIIFVAIILAQLRLPKGKRG